MSSSPGASIQVLKNGEPTDARATEVDGGLRYLVPVTPEDRRVQIQAELDGKSAVFGMDLIRGEKDESIDRAIRLHRAGKSIQARACLEKALARDGQRNCGRRHGVLARLRLAGGDTGPAIEQFRRAIRCHAQAGELQRQVDDATALAHCLIYKQGRMVEARAILDRLEDKRRGCGESDYYRAYYRGLAASGVGDLRHALRQLDAASCIARRLGLTGLERTAREVTARHLQLTGRTREAIAILEGLLDTAPADLSPCRRAQLMNNLAWSRLLQREAGRNAPDATGVLEEARKLFDRHCQHLKDERQNVRINLALQAVHSRRTDRARRWLGQIEDRPGRFFSWKMDLEGRIALAAKQAGRAAEIYGRMRARIDETLRPDQAFRAAMGLALALRAQGRIERALQAARHAERLTRQAARRVALGQGKAAAITPRLPATQLRVAMLLEQGRIAEAESAARRARARVLQTLAPGDRLAGLSSKQRREWDRILSRYREERQALESDSARDWKLPADRLRVARARRADRQRNLRVLLDEAMKMLGTRRPVGWEPPAPRAGELVLFYFPLEDGWVGFASDSGGKTVRRLGKIPRQATLSEWSRLLLSPFRQAIEDCRRLRILATGRLQEIDFHALPWGDDILLAHRPVVYGTDIPGPAGAPEGKPMRILAVLDPTGDLPRARGERPGFPGAGKPVVLVGQQATHRRFRREVEKAGWLHYSGHGIFSGQAGMDSALLLAEGGRFELGDVLALSRVPDTVVLLGCQTGRAEALPVAGLGLAQAFLLRGSSRVIASTRPLSDSGAASLSARLYEFPGQDVADSLRRAQLFLRSEHPAADWAGLRILVP